jgi:hypothetical protein
MPLTSTEKELVILYEASEKLIAGHSHEQEYHATFKKMTSSS